MKVSTYRIPAQTEQSRALVATARKEVSTGVPAHEALGFGAIPSESGTLVMVADALLAYESARSTAATYARLRFDGVALAYDAGQVGKGKAYSGQRDLAKAFGMTQGRVSQIRTAQQEAERVSVNRSALKAAAKQGGIVVVEGLSQHISALAVGTDEPTLMDAIKTLEAGRIPSGPARTLDVERLTATAERLLSMTGDVIDVTADRDAIERVIAMLTTARGNLTSAIRTAPANVSALVDG